MTISLAHRRYVWLPDDEIEIAPPVKTKLYNEADHPRDDHGKWTDGGGGLTVHDWPPKGNEKYKPVEGETDAERYARFRAEEKAGAQASIDAGAFKHPMIKGSQIYAWGASHSGSSAITGSSASMMGVDGYRSEDDDEYHDKLATQFLQAVYDSPGSSETLYHGFEDKVGIDWKTGDTLSLPLMASSGNFDTSASYGVRDEKQTTMPTVLVFPKGTRMGGYARGSKTNPDGTVFDFGYCWDEAVVAGTFEVGRITESTGSAWWNPKVRVIELIPRGVFNPKTEKMEKL